MSVHQLRPARRLSLPFPEKARLVCETFGLPEPTLADFIGYTLRRRKEGAEVGLKSGGGHWWNLSYLTGHYPANFKEARIWVAGYLARYGRDAVEVDRRGRMEGKGNE